MTGNVSRRARQAGGAGRGFTLIELLVVLAIMASLLTLVAPNYFGKIRASDETVLKHNLAAMRDAIDKFQGDVGRYPATLEELVTRRYLRQVPVDPVTGRQDGWRPIAREGIEGVVDVKSGAQGKGSDGTPYQDW